MEKKETRLGSHLVGHDHPVYVIAEGGLTNWGDVDLAKRQVDAAMAAGADAIKFQAQTTEALVSKKVDPYWYRRLKYKELSHDKLHELHDYCAIRNIDFFVTAHTETDLDFLDRELDVPFFKIGSGESINDDFLKNVGTRGKPVVISLGLHLTEEEIDKSIRTLEEAGAKEIVILHCNTVYPTPVPFSDLRMIERLRERFPYPIGYSDHTVGWHIPLAAVALGACVLEKHLSFDKTDKRSLDCPGSCDPEDLKRYVAHIREVEQALTPPPPAKQDAILQARRWAAQSAIATHDLAAGTILTESCIAFKRPGTGILQTDAHKIIGKKTTKTIGEDELIKETDVG